MKAIIVVLAIVALVCGAFAGLGWIISKAIEIKPEPLPEVRLRAGQLAALRPEAK